MRNGIVDDSVIKLGKNFVEWRAKTPFALVIEKSNVFSLQRAAVRGRVFSLSETKLSLVLSLISEIPCYFDAEFS